MNSDTSEEIEKIELAQYQALKDNLKDSNPEYAHILTQSGNSDFNKNFQTNQ